MKGILYIALFICLPIYALAQSPDEIYREANPEYIQQTDNSEYAVLLQKLTYAKTSGNQQNFEKYLNELRLKYSGKNITTGSQLPPNGNCFIPTMTQPEEPVSMPDWGNTGIRIFNGSVGSSSPGNPNAFNRQVKIEADTLGVLYSAFMNSAKDTLFFYRSTNRGASWAKIQALFSGLAFTYYSFDFAVADTTGGFKIGMVVSLISSAGTYAGTVYYGDMKSDGTGFASNTVFVPLAGRGVIGPVICTDSYNWNPGSTYWYIAASNCDMNTGVTNFVPVAYTPDWGNTWIHDTARSTYNDYELDIDYNYDSVYVLMTNNLTTSNENLRIRGIRLSEWGTNIAWRQVNPASTSSPEFNGCIAVNRKNNDFAVSFTINESSNFNVQYSYVLGGSNTWSYNNVLADQSNNETRSYIHSSPQQSGAFRIVFCSESSGLDTVIYLSTLNIASGFVSRTIASRTNLSTGILAPCVTGYMFNGITPGGGVVYAGNGPSNIWFNGSDVVTEINSVSGNIPDKFSLSQNYPNPFNPVTKINFSIPKNNLVQIKVYDVTGKEVAELLNKNLNAGEYILSFNAAKLTSGVYFYKLSSGSFSDVKKMLLIK